MTSDDLRSLIQAAIHQIASDGRAVIVAHAASIPLAARADFVVNTDVLAAEQAAEVIVCAAGARP